MEKQIKRGLTTDTFEDIIRIFLSGCDQEVKEIVHDRSGAIKYEEDFDASYGWIGIMCDMFEKIALFLKNGSCLKIYDGYNDIKLSVIDGETIHHIYH